MAPELVSTPFTVTVPSYDTISSTGTLADDAHPGPNANATELQRAAIRTPITPKHRYMKIRSFVTAQERDRAISPTAARWEHIRPDSVLICPMGYYYPPGCWQKICDMMMFTQSQGLHVGMQELQDRCFNPYDALGTMRNEAIMIAQNEGFEWLLYLDNDVMPDRDCLLRLLNWQLPIVSPYVAEPGTGRRLFGPDWNPNQGIRPAKWTVLSMLLMRTSVFNCMGTPSRFWSDAIGADEGYHFQTLWHYGHQPWVDTNTQLVTAGGPHYPLSSNRLNPEQRRELWERISKNRVNGPDRTVARGEDQGKEYMPVATNPLTIITQERKDLALVDDGLTYEQRQQVHDFILRLRIDPPNRAPVDPNTPGVIDGEYTPFVQPPGEPPAPVNVQIWGGG